MKGKECPALVPVSGILLRYVAEAEVWPRQCVFSERLKIKDVSVNKSEVEKPEPVAQLK